MNDEKPKQGKLNWWLVGIFAFFVVLGLIIVLVILALNNKNVFDGEGEQSGSVDSAYVLSRLETTYSSLDTYVAEDSEHLQEMAMKYCTEKISEAKDKDVLYDTVIACTRFMMDHDLFYDSIAIIDMIDLDALSVSQKLNIYDYYSVLYSKLGETEKSLEYEVKYQDLIEQEGRAVQ